MPWPSSETLLDLSRTIASAAANWWIQSTLLIAAGLAVGGLCRRRGSAVQSVVYRTTLAAVLAAPLVTWGLQRIGVSGWSIAMPRAWSLAETSTIAQVVAVDDSRPLDRSNAGGGVSGAFDPLESTSESIPSFPLDAGARVAPSSAGAPDVDFDTPAPASPSLAAPTPPAQVPADAAPVITIHLFGKVAAAVSAAWLLVATVLLARMAVAWRRLGQIRRGAAPAEQSVQAACRNLAGRLSVTPPVVLRSPYLPSPCLAGLRRPAVLLPEIPGELPVHDVLVHELAHLSRGDCYWNLIRQFASGVLFFQPLIWVLSRRIEATAEEVCDDFVVHLGGDRRNYAYRLCDIAELSLAPFAPAGVGIVSLRSMLAQRVARIMDTSRSLSTRVGGALLAVVLAGGLIGALAAGLVGLSGSASAVTRGDDASETDVEADSARGENAEESADEDDAITVRGQVLDPDGKPVPDADVHVLRWYWNFGDHKPLASTTADANGRFTISYHKSQFAENAGRPNQWRETYIASFVDGFGPGWAHYDRLKPGEEAVVKLAVDDVPIEGRVIDLEGNPVIGAMIEVGNIAEPKGGSLDAYLAAIKSGQAISTAYAHIDESLPDSDVQVWPKVLTDADGRFRFTGLGRERRVTLHLSGPTIVTDSIDAATRVMEPIVHPAYDYQDADDTTQYGAQFEYTAAPSRAIEGVVRDADSGEAIAGAEIWSWKFAGADISGITTVRTKSGADGHFRLEGMPKGEGNRVIVVPTGLPYFNAEVDVPNPTGTDPAPLDVELHRGVWVTGRVTDRATGKPVSAHIHYITFPDNKQAQGLEEFEFGRHGMGVQDMFRTDADGRYRVVALPGRGIIGVRSILTPYPGGQGYHDIEGAEDRESFMKFNGVFSPSEKFPTAVKETQVDQNAAENVCDFELDAGGRMTIRTVDAEGEPLVGVQVTGLSEIDGHMEPMEGAEFDLVCFRPGENRTVLLYHPDRRLGKSLRVKYEDDSQPLTITLEPLGVVTGTLVNDGEPVSGATLNFRVAGDNDYGRAIRGGATDAEGRFRHDEILPGLRYVISSEGAGMEFSTIAKELEVAAGETVDLGTIDIAVEERPEPMRSGSGEANVQADAESPGNGKRNDDDLALKFSGNVVTPDGKPAADAELYLVFHIPQPTGLLQPSWKPMGRTNAKGEFQLTVNPRDLGIGVRRAETMGSSLVAVKDGYGFAFAPSGLYETSGAWRKAIEGKMAEAPAELLASLQRMLAGAGGPLRLTVDDSPLTGRVIDVDGEPVAGVKVTLLEIWTGENDDLDAWRAAANEEKADYYSARMTTPRSMNGPQVRSIVRPAVTDANGQFIMRGIGRGRIAELLVEGPGVAAERIFARTEAGEPVVLQRERRSPDLGDYTYYPAEFTLVAGPSVPIEGIVRDAKTKRPLAGVTVKSQARHGELINGWGQDFVRAVTDDEGRYRLLGMPIGDGNRIAAIAPTDEPYFSVSAKAATRTDQDSLNLDFDLPRGVWIEGRVTDKQTGRGLPGQLDYLVPRDHPHYALARGFNVDERDRLQADDQGRFRIAGLPGLGYVTFMAFDHQDYPRSSAVIGLDGKPKSAERMVETAPSFLMLGNNHAVAEVNPSADDDRYELALQLDGGKVVGHVVDDEGKPVTGFAYSGRIDAFGTWGPGKGDAFELLGYNATTPRRVIFAHAERNLAGSLTASGETPELVAQLQPAGKVVGRLIDADGAPLPNMTLLPYSPPMARPGDASQAAQLNAPPLPPNLAHSQAGEHETDANGRFEIACLAPGIQYRLRAIDRASMSPSRPRTPSISGPIDAVIVVEPGQTLDLGDVKLADGEELATATTARATAARTTAAPGQDENERAESSPAKRVRGRVTGADNRPLAGADVAVTARPKAPRRGGDLDHHADILAAGKTDADGAFDLPLANASTETHQYPMLIARAPGAALGWKTVDLDAASMELNVQLAAEAPIAMRLVDIEGQPAAGARVRVQSVMKRSLLSQLLGGDGVGFSGENAPAAWIKPIVADANGRIEIPHLAEDFGMSLQVEGDERFAPQDIALNTGMAEQRGERDATYRSLVVNDIGADGTAVLPLAPAQLFTGTVTYADTGEPAPQARLTIWASQQEFGSMTSVGGRADGAGRYRISPNPGIRFGVNAYPPDGAPYLVRSVEPIEWHGGDKSREVNVQLPRGVMVQGLVIEAGTKKPVAGASVQYVPESENNPHDKDDIVTGWQVMQVTDDQGRFQLAVLPGPGRVLVHGPDGEYVLHEVSGRELYRGKPGGRRNYASAIERIDPKVDDGPLPMTIAIQRGSSVKGELVDPDGTPIDQAVMLTRLTIRPFWLSWHGQPVDVVGGRFTVTGLQADEEVPVHFLDARRKLGATLLARAGMEPPRVVLEPCGKAAMRFVDDDGGPIEDYEPQIEIVVTPGAHQFSDMAREGDTLAADADFISNADRLNHPGYEKSDATGRLEVAALIPGAAYRIVAFRDGKFAVAKDFVAEADKTVDLGDLIVQRQDQ
jgi:beta-lactamase regulating signal transducer with metallopeptidase domain/protocatechuate 3,4-dioxygenase beta subunit